MTSPQRAPRRLLILFCGLVPLLVVTALLRASPAAACSVCYGGDDNGSGMVTSARLGVFLLLAITMVVLGAFARFFFYLRILAS